MRAPDFWYSTESKKAPLLGRLLSDLCLPLSYLYAWVGERRQRKTKAFRAPIPVICVGNLTAGGTGKTPVTLALGKELLARGENPFILSRGYGGSESGPLQVDTSCHTSRQVGDEPLLMASHLPVIIARDRMQGAKLAHAEGASLILMDDGFQNPSLEKGFSLIVVDGSLGFGNNRVLPAGPLREPVKTGLKRASAIMTMGPKSQRVHSIFTSHQLPLFSAKLVPSHKEESIKTPTIAFAGIGRPEKFFKSAQEQGFDLLATCAFADHHPYTKKEEERLLQEAKDKGAQLLTTEKDFIRLSPHMRSHTKTLPVHVEIEGIDDLMNIITETINAFRLKT